MVSDHLKECPFDAPENLYVFIIVLENPLLLRPEKFHIVLQRVIESYFFSHRYMQVVTAILAIPKSYRVMFFGWLKHFSSEYFSRIVLVMQSYLSFILTERSANLDPAPAVLVIDRFAIDPSRSNLDFDCSLFACNQEASIVPSSMFSNDLIPLTINVLEEWSKFKSSDVSKIFNFFSYQFLFPIEAKNQIIRSEFRNQMISQSNRHFTKYILSSNRASDRPLPRGVAVKTDPINPLQISLVLELRVNRSNLLQSLETSIRGILEDDISTLLLPLT